MTSKTYFNGKLLLKIFGLILAFSAVGFLLLVVAYTLPRNRIRGHVSESAIYYTEGHEWAQRLWQTRADTYSDAYRLSIAAGPNENPFRSAALALRNIPVGDDVKDIHGEMKALYASDAYDQVEVKQGDYGRYWHGYVIFLAPLLFFLSPAEINVLNYSLQFILIVALLLLTYKKYGTKLTLAIAFYIYALNPVTTASCFQYAPGFYLSVLPMILILLFHEKLREQGRYLLLFTFIGCAINYLDLLSFPLVTLGAPLALSVYLDNQSEQKKASVQLFSIIMRSGAWLLGYALTWVLKWAIATLVTGENMFANAIELIFYRSVGEGYSRVSAILRNVGTMFSIPTIIVCVALLAAFLILWRRKKITVDWRNKKALFFALIAVYPFVWYSVLVNHSWVHIFMTHRLLAISMFCVALYLARISSRVIEKKGKNASRRLKSKVHR